MTNISSVLNNTGNTTALLTSFNALDASQQKVLLSSTLLNEQQKSQCMTMAALSSANLKYTAEELAKVSGISAETMANWGLIQSTDTLTMSQLAELASSDAQAKKVLEKIITQNAQKVANGEIIASNIGLAASEGTATLATGSFTTAIKANISAMWTWMTTTPLGWLTLLVAGVFTAVKAYDLFTISVDEQREAMEESISAYETAQSELSSITSELESNEKAIGELLAKDKLTFAEKGQLEELKEINAELRIQKDLSERTNNKAKKDAAVDAAKLYEKQFGNYDISESKIDEYALDNRVSLLTSDEDDISSMLAGYRQFVKLREQAFKDKDQYNIEQFTKSTDSIKENLFETAQELQTQKDAMLDYYNTIKDMPYNNLTKEQKEVVNAYNETSEAILLIYKELDRAKWNELQFSKVTQEFNDTTQKLQELGAEGKVTAEKLKDRAYAEFISKLQEIGFIADDSTGSLQFVANAFNGTTDAAQNYVKQLKGNEIRDFIDNLSDEAKALGVTEDALADLVAEHILFNNTGIDTSSKQEAFRQLADVIADTKDEAEYLLMLLDAAFNGTTVNLSDTNEPFSGVSLYRKDTVLGDIQVDPKKILKERFGIGEWLYSSNDDDDDESKYKPTGDGDSSSKNEPLDNYLKYAENLYKVHQDEEKYINDLQWALDNLVKSAEEELEITEKINEAYRDMADNRIKDLEHQIEMTKNLKGENADVIAQLNEIQRVSHEEADRLRSMGYDDNSNEIQELQKQWWDAEKEKLDWRLNLSKDWIDERNRLGDWKLFNDNEVDAWERVIKWLKEEYPHAIDEIKEAEESLFEARKEQLDKLSDFGSSYLDSQKTLLEAYFDVRNVISDARHEINKELIASKAMEEYLDEKTREFLFNQEDYNALSRELNEIQSEAIRLKADYEDALNNSTLDTIEEITSEYEMQYEMLMKSYEIAKADLEVAKKKAKLNNVLNERNVRMFINGQWQWVANTQDVMDAKAELADAEYAQRMAKAGLTQQESINNLTEQQNHLGTIISQFGSGVIDLDTAAHNVVTAFDKVPAAIQEAFRKMQVSVSVGGSSSSFGGISYDKNFDYAAEMSKHTPGSSTWNALNAQRNAKIAGEKLDYKPFATGTRYTPPGNLLLGEEPEMFIDNSGHLIPINQPTLGNFGAGGIVFNQSQMTNLRDWWDLSNLATPSVSLASNARTSSESFVFSGDINVYNPTDAKDVADNVIGHIVQGLKLQRKSR